MKHKKLRKFPRLIKDVPYEIEWVDTFGYSGWFSEERIKEKTDKSSTNLTVGYFIEERNGFIILAMGKEAVNTEFLPYDSPEWIPRGYIKGIKRLR